MCKNSSFIHRVNEPHIFGLLMKCVLCLDKVVPYQFFNMIGNLLYNIIPMFTTLFFKHFCFANLIVEIQLFTSIIILKLYILLHIVVCCCILLVKISWSN